ncbi:MAG: HEAT repeat domain-containing protein [Verrucomicrobiota bacterium]
MLKKSVIIALIAGLSQSVHADLWSDLAAYTYGAESKAAEQLEKTVNETPVDQHPALEAELIKIIDSKDATEDGKHHACRALQRVGSETSVASLGALLHHPILSHYARLGLEEMTEIPAAGEALRKALDGAPANVLPGLVSSLGVRGDKKAVGAIGKLASHDDPAVAKASMMALSYISGNESLTAIQGAKIPDSLKAAQEESIVRCARGADTSAGSAALMKVYNNSKSDVHRVAAFTQMVNVDQDKAAGIIVDLIKGKHSYLRQGALRQIVSGQGAQLTSALVDALPDFDDASRAQVIELMSRRGDKGALDAVVGYLNSDNEPTKSAAIRTAAALGDGNTVKALIEQAKDGSGDQIYNAIGMMTDPGVNDALVGLLKSDGLKAAAISTLAKRGARGVGAHAVQLASDGNADVRKAAWSSMSQLASENELDTLMKVLVGIKDGAELAGAQNAIKTICSEAGDRNRSFDTIANYYDKSARATQLFVLELGSSIGTGKALDLERKALKSGDQEMVKKAIRALAAWPNDGAASDLMELAKNASSNSEKILALRGLIQVSGKGRSDKDKIERFKAASELVERPDEKRMLISALRDVRRPKALHMLKAYLGDEAVKREAEVSAIDLAWDLRKQFPEDVKAVAKIVIDNSQNKKVVGKAKSCFRETEGRKNK